MRNKIHLYSLSVQALHKAISMFISVNNVAFNMVFVVVVLFSNGTQILCYVDTEFHLVYFTLFTSKIHLFQMAPWLFQEPNLYSKYKIVFTGDIEKNRLQAFLAIPCKKPHGHW